MIREVIVVEGRSDVAALRRAVDADCLITGGFSLSPELLGQIDAAYKRRGIIILTDPDSAGERIRTFLRKRFPLAGHAFIPTAAAVGEDGRIGVEKAEPEQIRAYMAKRSLPFPVVFDRDGALAREFEGVRATPTTFLIDRAGKRISKTVGIIDFEKLRAFLESAAASG